MSEIQEIPVTAEREVAIVLFRNDLYDLAMEPELDPKVADLEECWRVGPKQVRQLLRTTTAT